MSKMLMFCLDLYDPVLAIAPLKFDHKCDQARERATPILAPYRAGRKGS